MEGRPRRRRSGGEVSAANRVEKRKINLSNEAVFLDTEQRTWERVHVRAQQRDLRMNQSKERPPDGQLKKEKRQRGRMARTTRHGLMQGTGVR